MNEKKLLAASANSRKAWELLTAHVEEGDFTETGRRILGVLSDYYKRDPAAKAADRETFDGLVLQSITIEKHKETFKLALEKLWEELQKVIDELDDPLPESRPVALGSMD